MINGLCTMVGDTARLDATVDMQSFIADYRKLHHGKALAIILPASSVRVGEVFALRTRHRVPVVPPGGKTAPCV